jgi:hypothetical protein
MIDACLAATTFEEIKILIIPREGISNRKKKNNPTLVQKNGYFNGVIKSSLANMW